jgi:hypothetical protein
VEHTRRWKQACSALINAQVQLGIRAPPRSSPCERGCGRAATLYHHPDYNLPELVTPLCGQCHSLVHSQKRSLRVLQRALEDRIERDALRDAMMRLSLRERVVAWAEYLRKRDRCHDHGAARIPEAAHVAGR